MSTRKRKPVPARRSLTFSRRARVTRSDLTTTRSFASGDGLYEVCEVCWKLGYGRYWLAVGRPDSPRPFISRHRTRDAAERRCEQVARGK